MQKNHEICILSATTQTNITGFTERIMCNGFLKNVKITAALFFLIILHGCSFSGSVIGPEYDEDTMAEILTEIHLAEARVSKMKFRSPDSSALVFKRLEEQIFIKHEIDTLEYRKSYEYYASDAIQWKLIYQKVNENLNSKENKPNDT